MTYSILIVDDEQGMRLVLRFMLESAGFAVTEAEDGRDALEKIVQYQPDVAIIDIMMPDMNGLEVCRILRGQKNTANLPIILLSTRPRSIAGKNGQNGSVTRYLTKPVSQHELIENIGKVLDAHRLSANGTS